MKNVYYFVIIIAIGLFSCEGGSCKKENSTNQTQGQTMTYVDPCASQNAQIVSLLQENATLRETVARLEERIKCLEGKQPAKSTGSSTGKSTGKSTKTSQKSATTQRQQTAPAAESRTLVPPSTGNVKSGNPGIANLDYLRQGGEILFCSRGNGREDMYFPDYAMMQGVTFSQAPVDNQLKGKNWKVEPTEFYEGDYGVTIDGTFYVSEELIIKSMQAGGETFNGQLDIKCPYTNWQNMPMTKDNGYYVYPTRNGGQ